MCVNNVKKFNRYLSRKMFFVHFFFKTAFLRKMMLNFAKFHVKSCINFFLVYFEWNNWLSYVFTIVGRYKHTIRHTNCHVNVDFKTFIFYQKRKNEIKSTILSANKCTVF